MGLDGEYTYFDRKLNWILKRNKKEDAEILMQLRNFVYSLDEDDYAGKYFKSQLIRYFYALKIIKQSLPKGSVLDVGSYPSHIHTCLLDLGYDADGADIAPERIPNSLAEAKKRTIQWDFEKGEAPLKKQYDNVLFLEVIEHLHVNPLNALYEISGLIKEKGLILVSTPNLFSLRNRINFIKGSYCQ